MSPVVPFCFSVFYDLTAKAISACIWAVPLVAALAVVRRNATARLVVGGSLLLIGIVAFGDSSRGYGVCTEEQIISVAPEVATYAGAARPIASVGNSESLAYRLALKVTNLKMTALADDGWYRKLPKLKMIHYRLQ